MRILACLLLALFAQSAASAQPATYVVQKGDCLWNIAAKTGVYHNAWKWPLLYEHNKTLISNPDLIEPGWVLKVPAAGLAQATMAIDYARDYPGPAALPAGKAAPYAKPVPGPAPVPAEAPQPGTSHGILVMLLALLACLGGALAIWLKQGRAEKPGGLVEVKPPVPPASAGQAAAILPSAPLVGEAGTPDGSPLRQALPQAADSEPSVRPEGQVEDPGQPHQHAA